MYKSRWNCKFPLDPILGKNEGVILAILKNVNDLVGHKLFFTFETTKITDKKLGVFVKKHEDVLKKLGTSIIKTEEMDSRPVWFECSTKDCLTDRARYQCVIEKNHIEEVLSGIWSLRNLAEFVFVTKNNMDFRKKGNTRKYENSSSRK